MSLSVEKTYILAEIGVNHNGSMDIARQMIDVAKGVNCDAVKFQCFEPELSYDGNHNLLAWLQKTHLTKDQLYSLKDYCGADIDFLCSAFDLPSLDTLRGMGLNTLKIPSSRNTDVEFLNEAGKRFSHFILSTGMCNEKDVDLTLLILKQHTELKNVALLHCVSSYPTPLKDVNLQAMLRLKGKAGKIGISDHTLGLTVPIAAVALGAQIVEKHLTLSRQMRGPDHPASIEPLELCGLVKTIRDVEKILGDGEKRIMGCERKYLYRKGK